MQITLNLPDDMAKEMFAQLPEQSRVDYIMNILKETWKNEALFKETAFTEPLLDLPFEALPSRGVVVTNELVNQLREQEGI